MTAQKAGRPGSLLEYLQLLDKGKQEPPERVIIIDDNKDIPEYPSRTAVLRWHE